MNRFTTGAQHSSRNHLRIVLAAMFFAATIGAATTVSAQSRDQDEKQHGGDFTPGNLVVSRSAFNQNSEFAQYPFIWNSVLTDASSGITSPICRDELNGPQGAFVRSLEVPNSLQNGVPPTKDQMVTSFSSKSELALNLSTDGAFLTFMGYLAPVDAFDVSNT